MKTGFYLSYSSSFDITGGAERNEMKGIRNKSALKFDVDRKKERRKENENKIETEEGSKGRVKRFRRSDAVEGG